MFYVSLQLLTVKTISREKWEKDEEIMFDTEEEAIIAQNILEEVLG